MRTIPGGEGRDTGHTNQAIAPPTVWRASYGARKRVCDAKLPLPLGEGGGEGGRAWRRSPHPRFARPLPEGEVRPCALRDRVGSGN